MNIILLSGGSGKRLWPFTNEGDSKQFLPIFQTEDGTYESMLQRMYRQIQKVDREAKITITASKTQMAAVYDQLGDMVSLCEEPCTRDTFPAIVLAAAYLYEVKKIPKEEVVVICPVDPYVEEDYFEALKELEQLAKKKEINLALMGIEPTCPSERYGYIIPSKKEKVSDVLKFKEKPTVEKAKMYLLQGALWNSGVFAIQIEKILEKAREVVSFRNYQEFYSRYHTLQKISFDYAVVEQEKKIQVMRFMGIWKDLGTWKTLTEVIKEKIIGNVIVSSDCDNVHVVNKLDLPILCIGLENIVVSANQNGILIADKEEADRIKPYVNQIRI